MFPDKLLQEAFLAAEYSLWETPVWLPCPETTKQQMLRGTTTCNPRTSGGSSRGNSHFCIMEKRRKIMTLDNLGVNSMTKEIEV